MKPFPAIFISLSMGVAPVQGQASPPDRAEITRVKAEIATCKDLAEIAYYAAIQHPTRPERRMRSYARRTAGEANGVRGPIPPRRIRDATDWGERANGNAAPADSRDSGMVGAIDYVADCLAGAWKIPEDTKPWPP